MSFTIVAPAVIVAVWLILQVVIIGVAQYSATLLAQRLEQLRYGYDSTAPSVLAVDANVVDEACSEIVRVTGNAAVDECTTRTGVDGSFEGYIEAGSVVVEPAFDQRIAPAVWNDAPVVECGSRPGVKVAMKAQPIGPEVVFGSVILDVEAWSCHPAGDVDGLPG